MYPVGTNGPQAGSTVLLHHCMQRELYFRVTEEVAVAGGLRVTTIRGTVRGANSADPGPGSYSRRSLIRETVFKATRCDGITIREFILIVPIGPQVNRDVRQSTVFAELAIIVVASENFVLKPGLAGDAGELFIILEMSAGNTDAVAFAFDTEVHPHLIWINKKRILSIFKIRREQMDSVHGLRVPVRAHVKTQFFHVV